MKTKLVLGFTLLLLLRAAAMAQFVWVELSFKAVLNPANAQRYYDFTEANVDQTIAQVNGMLAAYQRGYRFRRVEPIGNVGGLNDTTGPSKWYSRNPRAASTENPTQDNHKRMEVEALASKVTYAWNDNAVNYYITAGYGPPPQNAGDCAYPLANSHLIVLGTVDNQFVLLHETGHYFELYHTHGGCGCPSTGGCFMTNGFWVGDDGIADTLPEGAGDFCFTTQNQIAQANFRKTYAAGTTAEQKLVDDTFFNNMSYGLGRSLDRMTELQLDKWTDFANAQRANAVSGRTWFVAPNGNDLSPANTSAGPYRTVGKAQTVADGAGGDIILLRPGNYNQTLTISKPVTLRATRDGSATIGAP